MLQLTQQLKSGKMEILEVPLPILGKGQLIVRNHFSIISAGTEGKTVTDARKGYIAKARSRQKELKQVIEMVKTQGIRDTYQMVMNKLEASSPLGYSCCGEVIQVSDEIRDIKPGDFVACGGQGAYHADVVAVYRNLCVKIPGNVDAKSAAFTTIASVALQGIRQADLRIGESCVVLGLGLIGLITAELLKSGGIKVLGVDISDQQLDFARSLGLEIALNREQDGIEDAILNYTDGLGADAVIITAGSSTTDPVDFAGLICRKKARVVIVGAVPTGFSRENYYKKELDLRMSASYGPGRYDPVYEEKGIDYPAGYVRWTENRNMQAIVDLLATKKINFEKFITHHFDLEGATEAYELILKKTEHYCGLLINYDQKREPKGEVKLKPVNFKADQVNAGLIGAGSFAQNILLPLLKDKINPVGMATASGNESRYVAEKYGFAYCTDLPEQIFTDQNINTLFVLTRHNLHGQFVLRALQEGKNVFTEKPLTIDPDELEIIRKTYLEKGGMTRLLVGFNRRFSPFSDQIKKTFLDDQPKTLMFRINAGKLPGEHWVNDTEVGGGRIIGEVCHFMDLAYFYAGSKIKSVQASEIISTNSIQDTLVISLNFENGSIATINYFSNGNKKLAKEYIEVHCNGVSAIINDFKRMTIYGKKTVDYKLKKQDKGHRAEMEQFIKAIRNGSPSPIPFDELYHSTLTTFKVMESLNSGEMVSLE
jgi:predicted dehydrogenase/threonine dehydrogenase-like Zn-dependent dehydrogenase